MQAGTSSETLVAYLGVAIFFIILWSAICYFACLISGWFALGRRFRQQTEPYGEARSAGPFLYTIYMRGWTHYSSLIRLTAASDALYASVLFPFRIGHPPLRIPWDEIQFGRTKFFFRTYMVLTLGAQEKIPMRIPQRMARNLGILDRFPS